MGAVAGGLLGKDVRLMGSLVDDSPTEDTVAVLAQARVALERMGAPLTTDKE